jgi:hypothetical protein
MVRERKELQTINTTYVPCLSTCQQSDLSSINYFMVVFPNHTKSYSKSKHFSHTTNTHVSIDTSSSLSRGQQA